MVIIKKTTNFRHYNYSFKMRGFKFKPFMQIQKRLKKVHDHNVQTQLKETMFRAEFLFLSF